MKLFDLDVPHEWDIKQINPSTALGCYSDSLGSVETMVHLLFEGVLLERIRLSTSKLAMAPLKNESLTCINYCTSGRCECDLGEAGALVVGEGALCISSTKARSFTYPLGSYTGFEFWLDIEVLKRTPSPVLEAFGIDAGALEQRWCKDRAAAIIRPEGEVLYLCNALDALLAEDEPDICELRLATCCLLRSLLALEPKRYRDAIAYVQRSQRDMARAVHDGIMQSPADTFDLSRVATDFGVSTSSLRGYFERVYGCSPAAFAREAVMRSACERLVASDVSISDIAFASGYSNPSKFSAAFKREFGMNPLEYRRRKRLEEQKR